MCIYFCKDQFQGQLIKMITETLIKPPSPGMGFTAGSLMNDSLLQALGIRHVFASCGSEQDDHVNQVRTGGDWIMLATLGGGGTIAAGDGSFASLPTTLFLAPSGLCFEERAIRGAAWSWLCLRVGLAPGSPFLDLLPKQPWLGRPGLECFQCISDIVATLHGCPTGYRYVAVARLIVLLGILDRLIKRGKRPAISEAVDRACSLLCREPGRTWSVPELARRCGMSESSLAHRFHAETGDTPRRWLAAQRMREARRLLAGRISIKEVSERLGFSSRYHFTRVFTRLEGLPPGRFQRLATRR